MWQRLGRGLFSGFLLRQVAHLLPPACSRKYNNPIPMSSPPRPSRHAAEPASGSPGMDSDRSGVEYSESEEELGEQILPRAGSSGKTGSAPQPLDGARVTEDMASLAMSPAVLDSPAAAELAHGRSPFGTLEDSAIMLELSAGNMEAFDYLVQKYRRPIVSFMYRMVRNQAVAEELAQEVFLRVYRSRETYRAEARFSTWLYRIATNLGVNHARDTRRQRNASTVYLDEPDPETGSTPDVADATPGAEAQMLRRERLNAIRQHVLALPERQKMAVLMHKYEGMDYRQIGEVLKLSESATKSLLFRAYQTLRERLKEFV
jgi:RNA polymerase sigma-70 factor (ECF subfamily)